MMNAEFSRRTLLRGTALLGSSLAIKAAIPGQTIEYEPGLQPLTNSVDIDFFSPSSTPGHPHYSYLGSLNMAKKLLGDYYIPARRLFWQFGLNVFSEEKFKKQVISQYPEYGLVMGGLLAFSTHGYGVSEMQRQVAREYGYQSLPAYLPIQEGLSILELHHHDVLGNPAVLMHLSVDPIYERLFRLPNSKVVNLSVQVGTSAVIHKRRNIYVTHDPAYEQMTQERLTYFQERTTDGQPVYYFYNPTLYEEKDINGKPQIINKTDGQKAVEGVEGYHIIAAAQFNQYTEDQLSDIIKKTFQFHDQVNPPFYEIQGAYTGEYGKKNIQELFGFVKAFPEKLFFVAAGNYGDDLRGLRVELAEDWPDNVVVAGFWDQKKGYPRMFDAYDIFGADIYVDPVPFGVETGSSMATAILSTAGSILVDKGFSIFEAKKILFSCCNEVNIQARAPIPWDTTDSQAYMAAELHQKTEKVNVFNESIFRKYLTEIAG